MILALWSPGRQGGWKVNLPETRRLLMVTVSVTRLDPAHHTPAAPYSSLYSA